jgi:hypothetical protein
MDYNAQVIFTESGKWDPWFKLINLYCSERYKMPETYMHSGTGIRGTKMLIECPVDRRWLAGLDVSWPNSERTKASTYRYSDTKALVALILVKALVRKGRLAREEVNIYAQREQFKVELPARRN